MEPVLADHVPTQVAEAVARLRRSRSHHRRQDERADRQRRRAGQQSGIRPHEQPLGSFAHIRGSAGGGAAATAAGLVGASLDYWF